MVYRSITAVLFFSLLIGCVTHQESERLAEKPVQIESAATNLEAKPEPETFDFANIYCKDSIYTQFLQSAYESHIKRQSGRKLSKAEHKASLSYAKSVLLRPNRDLLREIPYVHDSRIDAWIAYFQSPTGRKDFLKWLDRSKRFEQIVFPTLRAQGLPKELYYLAMVESGFSNSAYSRSHASGTWQFMKPTAKSFGLQISPWVDERRNPHKSTLAAARYLATLHRKFNDWYLAMAAYNAGPNKIIRAIRETGSRDFWTLAKTNHLKAETKSYVPKILAAIQIAEDMQKYGFMVTPSSAEEPKLVTIPIEQPIKLEDLSRDLNIPLADLKFWNPELTRNLTPPSRDEPYLLHIDASYEKAFYQIAPNLNHYEISATQFHTVKRGDTIHSLARKYHVAADHILSLNPSMSPTRLTIGKQIVIPISSVRAKQSRG